MSEAIQVCGELPAQLSNNEPSPSELLTYYEERVSGLEAVKVHWLEQLEKEKLRLEESEQLA